MFHRSAVLLTILTAAVCATAQFGPSNSMGSMNDNASRVGLQASLSGNVQDNTGHPVNGARIDITDQSTGRIVGVAFTNPNGTFEVGNLPRGNYQVVATLGAADARQDVSVDGMAEVTLRMNTAAARSNMSGSANAVSVTQANVPGKARKMLEKAEEALHSARLTEAFDFVQKALMVCPTYAKALTLRGILNMEKGDTKAAEPDLEKAVELDYGDDLGFVALGSLYNTEGRFDNALKTLEHGVSLNPKSWQANLEMARAEIGKQDFGAAVRSLDRSEMFAPATVTVTKLFRAEALAGLKDYQGAIDALQDFVNKSPKDPNVPQAEQMLAKLREVSAINQK
jgi:tetratricopeptide (TPR) repeat protein